MQKLFDMDAPRQLDDALDMRRGGGCRSEKCVSLLATYCEKNWLDDLESWNLGECW
jgi:hypothetical protein